jgi:hypothetical protein
MGKFWLWGIMKGLMFFRCAALKDKELVVYEYKMD